MNLSARIALQFDETIACFDLRKLPHRANLDLPLRAAADPLSPEVSLQRAMCQPVDSTKLALSQPAGPKLCHQPLDLLDAMAPPSLNFFAFVHPASSAEPCAPDQMGYLPQVTGSQAKIGPQPLRSHEGSFPVKPDLRP